MQECGPRRQAGPQGGHHGHLATVPWVVSDQVTILGCAFCNQSTDLKACEGGAEGGSEKAQAAMNPRPSPFLEAQGWGTAGHGRRSPTDSQMT